MDEFFGTLFGSTVVSQQLAYLEASLLKDIWETFYSTVLSTFFAYVIGLPLGIILVTGEPDGVRPLPRALMRVINVIVNLLRSVPFLILMVLVIPLSRVIIGTSVGTVASIIPLVVAAFPFVARLVEASLRESDHGILEAAQAMGCTPMQITFKVMLPEALPSLINGFTTAFITILGYGAMSAAIGGGGLPTSCMSLVAVLFPKNRHKMMGFAVNVFPLAQIIGSNFGVLVTKLTGSWRGVFWVNAVVMIIAIIVFALYMPRSKRDEDVSIRQIDFLGALLMCGSVCFLMLAITNFKSVTSGLSSSLLVRIILFFAVFVLLAVLFVLRVRTAQHPIVDRKVLFNKKFSSVTIFFFIYGFVALGMAQMIPTFAQSVYGFSDAWAAAVVA